MSISVDLSGKVVLITGASSGIGRHSAWLLARNGASVALAARRTDVLEKLAAEISASDGRAHCVHLDVTSSTSIRGAVSEVVRHFGHLEVLVNNSGIALAKPILEHTEDDWDRVLNTNLRGAFLMATEFSRYLRNAKRRGSIVNIGSILGLRQAGTVAPYAISKAGLLQLTKVLALELAPFGIRVNAIAPGYIASDLNREFFSTVAGEQLIGRIPQRRIGTLAELEGPLLLLVSDASSYMTGSVLVVDGGHLTSTL